MDHVIRDINFLVKLFTKNIRIPDIKKDNLYLVTDVTTLLFD